MRATVGPDGPCAIRVAENDDGSVCVTGTALQQQSTLRGHGLLGDEDQGHSVVPVHDAVASAMTRYGGFGIPATGTPYHDLLPAVLAQRVTGREAAVQWAAVCREWGEPVTLGSTTLLAPPRPEVLARVPYHEMHLMGIDRRRAETLRNVARHGERLVEGWLPGEPAHERTLALRLIPGVGQWTAAVAGWTAFADPDALEVGDFHAKNTVAFALTGRHRGTDDEMCSLLAPYAGQRQRVLQWLRLAGHRAPAHGPRRRIVSIARL